MLTRRFWGFIGLALIAALFAVIPLASKNALAQSSSNNYQMVESEFGSSSSNESCSTTYCASVSIGNDSQGSSLTTAEFGEANYSEPFLEMIVAAGSSNLGDLTTEVTGTKTLNVQIRNYESGGYRLMIVGTPPTYGDHSLTALATPSDAIAGDEQFGINVVANTSPSAGANPVLQGGGDGTSLVTSNYNTANKFMYVDGAAGAETATNTGGADFTVTMMVNISNSTPAGRYSSDFSAVVVPYF